MQRHDLHDFLKLLVILDVQLLKALPMLVPILNINPPRSWRNIWLIQNNFRRSHIREAFRPEWDLDNCSVDIEMQCAGAAEREKIRELDVIGRRRHGYMRIEKSPLSFIGCVTLGMTGEIQASFTKVPFLFLE
jgi:hypothetical protein